MAKKNRFQNNNDMPVESVSLSEIIPDDLFRVRVKEDQSTIKKYTEHLLEYKEATNSNSNIPFPFEPIIYWQNGSKKILIAGFHRYFATKEAGLKKIPAYRFTGSKIEALKMAVQDNSKNGLPYKYGDYKICIRKLLEAESTISPKELKTLTGASRTYCYTERKKFEKEKNKTFTSEQSEDTTGESQTDKKQKEKQTNIIYWNRLKGLPQDKRIVMFLDASDQFVNGLSDETKVTFLNKFTDRMTNILNKLQKEQKTQPT